MVHDWRDFWLRTYHPMEGSNTLGFDDQSFDVNLTVWDRNGSNFWLWTRCPMEEN